MAMARESSFMPAIKCSSCGIDVQISLMGEHICAGAAIQISAADTHSFDDRYNVPPLPEKFSRRPPPPVDTGAANRGFARPGPGTPGHQPRNDLNHAANLFRPPTRSNEDGRPKTAGSGSSTQPQPVRRPGGYGGFGDSAGQDGGSLSQSPSQQGGGFLQRAGPITPGPFDANRRPSLANNAPTPKQEPRDRWGGGPDRPGTSHADTSSSNGFSSPRLPRKDGYGGFGPPSMPDDSVEPGMLNRSETFPKPSFTKEPPLRTPSAPGVRPDRYGSANNGRRPSVGPDTSRPPPPRTSMIRPHTAGKQAGAGSVDVAAEFGIGNPYHTPSDSASSGYSTFSGPSQSSSQTSPARSQSRRQGSDVNLVDQARSQPSAANQRNNGLRIDPAASSQPPLRTPSPLVDSPFAMSPRESPYGSAPQSNRRQEDLSPRAYDHPMPSPRLGSSPHQGRDYFATGAQPQLRNNGVPDWMGTSPPSTRANPPLRKGSRDPTGSRGDCKACHLPITGKSVSSADGRLTGKYHKACFVCTTCLEPFASAEFYVLNDKPFCEQHYHKLNGSLCGGCGRGIEGQYLEDEALVKYHAGCFRCLDCGQSLSDGYFDVEGKSYCERDAWRRVQQAWNGGAGAAYAEPDPYPPAGAPRGGTAGRRPPPSAALGLPGNPAPRARPNGRPMPGSQGMGRGPYGAPPSSRAGPGAGPKLNKRMTRTGMM